MEKELQTILTTSTNWNRIYEQLAARNTSDTVSAGKLFEYFCKFYYLTEPTVAPDYRHVWLYAETPPEVKQKLNLAEHDHGVDVILEGLDGAFTVAQCKFRNDQSSRLSWTKDKIANLFAEADRADFIIVFTNASDLDEYSKGKQAEKFNLVTQGELVEIQPETIRKMIELIEKKRIPVTSLITPREDQVVAIEKVLTGFQDCDRGQLILPCGAGKTLVALWIKEQMDSKHTLVLVPSLALLRQTKNEWHSIQKKWQPYLCVCSEGDIDRGPDMPVVHTYEIGGRVTTNHNAIRDFLGRHEKSTIYATYQSLDAIIEAVKSTNFQFNLAICDEAHKTAGSKLGAFGKIHNNDLVPVEKRLYMTATPRIVSEQVKDRLGEEVTKYLADMGDPTIFGPEFHRLSFAEAIDRGILVDYQIIAIGVSDAELQSQLLHRQFAGDTETTLDDIANNYALEKVMERHGATHAITFHSSVKRAEQFKLRHQKLYAGIFSGHVSGRQTTNERNVIMSQFKNSPKAVVTNARCLTEGVNVPTIDVVYFCDPKNSKIDIVQASGRALRTAIHKNKKMGYVVVPIFHRDQEKIEGTIEGSAFKNLITVVRTLCDQDERLVDEINNIKINKGIRQLASQSTHIQIETALPLIALENFGNKLKEAIFEQVVDRTADNWTVMYEKLKLFRKKNPIVWPNPSSEDLNERILKQWCVKNRWAFKKGKLSPERKKALDSIGFLWLDNNSKDSLAEPLSLEEIRKKFPSRAQEINLEKQAPDLLDAGEKVMKAKRKQIFLENFALLLAFRQKNPNYWPYAKSKERAERKLYAWCATIRQAFEKNELDPDMKKKFDDIGFLWPSSLSQKTPKDQLGNRNLPSVVKKRSYTVPAIQQSEEDKSPIRLADIAKALRITTQELRHELQKTSFGVEDAALEVDRALGNGIIRYLRGRVRHKKK